MGVSSLGGSPAQPPRHPFVAFYKEAIRMAQLASDITYTTGTTTNQTGLIIAKTLTIASPATLTFDRATMPIIFADTLVLNGTISVWNGALFNDTDNFISKGGDSRGSVAIFAKTITGSGLIEAVGGEGESPTLSGTAQGLMASPNPSFNLNAYYYGNGGFVDRLVPSGGTGGRPPRNTAYSKFYDTLTQSILPFIYPPFVSEIIPDSIYTSAFGASGSATASTSSGYANGGGGGASIYSAGGNGGVGGTTGAGGTGHLGTGGGGGGGGGYIYIMSENAIPAISADVTGGRGGDGYNSGASGGGGAGGVISVISPYSGLVASVSGGNSGNVNAGYGASSGIAGSYGIYINTKDNLAT
jgi:hypothetical protein